MRSRCARKMWMAWRSGRRGKNTRNIGREDSASTAPTRLRTARAGRSRGGALLVKWCWGLDGTEACTPVVPEHFVSHWNRQCETKRRAGKRANAKPIPADRFARLAKARHYASSCAPRVGDVDASELMVPARGSHHVGYLLKARKAARRPSRRMLDAATCAFRRRLAARASVVAAALAFPFAFAPARVGMLQAEVVGRGATLLLVES